MRRALAALLVLAFATSQSLAQAQPPAAQPQNAQPPAAKLPVPPAEKLVLLIRVSLLTLNDALQTGNYTVLRDRAGPSFQRNNTAAALGRTFARLEQQGVDLAPVAVLTPVLSIAEVSGPEQRLHVGGHFPGEATQINFDLTFEPFDGHWRLFGLSVGPAPVTPPKPVAQKAAPAAPAPPKPPAKK